jgi:DNA-binding transcriptional MerR regulator
VVQSEHFSIGDVLNQLRDEFPDVTISKIRFLESQGLVEPERTPSGYRKFYARDVERLRFILRQQRDQFLPLKVIKERLDDLDANGGLPVDSDSVVAAAPEPEPETEQKSKRGRRPKQQPLKEPALFEQTRKEREVAEARRASAAIADGAGPEDLSASESGVSMTRAELARAANLTDEQLASLEEYGLIAPAHTAKDRVLFDDDALEVARVAAGFMKHGIEPRHLRMYRAFAEREAGLFEQVLLPYRRQRNPEAQRRTAETLAELAGLGRQLRTAMLRQAARRTLGG